MKTSMKLLLSFVALFIAISCSDDTTSVSATGEKEPVEVVKADSTLDSLEVIKIVSDSIIISPSVDMMVRDYAGGSTISSSDASSGSSSDYVGESSSAILADTTEVIEEPVEEKISAGQLTAAEWSDLNNWKFWKNLQQHTEISGPVATWKMNSYSKIKVIVVSEGKTPFTDTPVQLLDSNGMTMYEARTDENGKSELFTSMFKEYNGKVTVTTIGSTVELAEGVDSITIIPAVKSIPQASNRLDIMFVFDATGSMGDEMSYLKAEMEDVINRVSAQSNRNIRLSCDFYRDSGDDYVVKSFPFSENVSEVVAQLAAQSAGGGGDYPEAVEKGLEDAIFEHEWSSNNATRVLFLILDAPPHDNDDVRESLRKSTLEAAKKGIHIIPIASSGVDKSTEVLMRSLAIATNSSYLFLTSDSGIGGEHIEPTIGDYEVIPLNDLIYDVIMRYSGQ